MIDKVNILTDKNTLANAVNIAIAGRISERRKAAALSLDRLAELSGVSKGMLVQIEQGRANPSIATLCKVASGLRVSVAELVAVAEGGLSPVRLVTCNEIVPLWKGPKGGSAALLVGSDGPDMLELWSWELRPGERYEAQPHPTGTEELISVSEGTLALEIDGDIYQVTTGSAAFARTVRPHAYACSGCQAVRFTMVVYEAGRPTERS